MINLFIPNKKTLMLIIGLVIFILLITLVSLFSAQDAPISPQPSISPSRAPLNNLPQSGDNLPAPQAYEPDKLEENYQRIINKQELTPDEEAAKQRLLAPFEGNSGTITTTDQFRVEYLRTPRYFMVEILSNDIQSAKDAAQNWLNQQGISDAGICNLPVIFYISEEVKNYLASNNLQFDPTPRGCGQ